MMDTPMNSTVKLNSPRKRKLRTLGQGNAVGYSFMSPWLFGMLVLTAGSMLFTLYLAFTNYDLLSAPKWAGAVNFRHLWTDPNFWTSVKVTLLYVVLSVPCRMIASLLVATLVSKQVRFIGVYRALIYLPSLIGASVGASIGWKNVFAQTGPIDSFLALFGVKGPVWLGNPSTAIIVLVLLSIWQFGSEMVIFLAGMKQIPAYLYESATIDGASSFQRYIRITLPMLSPLIFFNLLMGTISSFMVFTQVYVITDGGPMNSTLFYILYVYQQGFQYFHMGYAAAMAIILLVIIALCTGFLFLTARYWVNYDV